MQSEHLILKISFLDKRWYIAITPVFFLGSSMCWVIVKDQRTIQDLVKQEQGLQEEISDIRDQKRNQQYLTQHSADIKPLSLPIKSEVWRQLHRLPLQHWQQTSSGLEIGFILSWPDIKRVIPLIPNLIEADQTMRYRIVKQSSALLLTVWIDDAETH